MIMGNFMLINACYGKLFIESYSILKEKNEYPGIHDLLKESLYLVLNESSQKKILCSNPAEDKIFR